ncbi:hypothetical protein CPC16_000790 [Podila verticillata]|nr:hypothetical protein CPC16_000790 [Podila verticillata]KAI9237007.1 MAG: hypothetical protein BYD32DRAFT_417421 [Podila humilis]
MTTTSMSSRHRALLGALLIFCIGSLLTFSMRPISENSEWVVSRRPASGTGAQGASESPSTSDERTGTGARGTDQENNSDLDSSASLSTYSLQSLQALVRGTILETSEDLLDPTRNIRPRSSLSSGSSLHGGNNGGPRLDLKPDDLNPEPENDEDEDTGADEEDENNGNENESEEEDEDLRDDQVTDDPTQASNAEDSIDQNSGANDEQLEDEGLGESDEDPDQSKEQITKIEPTLNEILDNEEEPSSKLGSSLADFDTVGILDPTANYLLFVPSGETIESQFFSLLTSLWIAKHSNRTLIIPPPMMSPPSLSALYPYFAGPKGRKRQRWSTLFDLRTVQRAQSMVLIDNTRPVLQTPFTEEMALEEENPTTDEQAIPFLFEDDDEGVNDDNPTLRTVPVKIKCYGPPTAGSWKGLDFAGRHFLNRYNLVADFEILEDAYWNLRPAEIQKYWRATPSFGPSSATDKITTHHQQLACISGAEFVGREDTVMEEMIWQDLGFPISFSRGVKQQAQQSIVQVLRALESDDKRNGYIGVHIDKLPSREICRHGVSSSPNNDVGNTDVNNAAKLEELHAPQPAQNAALSISSPVLSQCLWTVDLIAKRIAMLQLTEGVTPRPVIVTTTETDLEILAKIDQQGWLRIGNEEFGAGLFDDGDDLGGYGNQVTRAYVMANSAIFVGSRASALGIHTAFTMKNQGKLRQVPPRWELY